MGVAFSLCVIAAGAILAFAVTGSPSGVDIQTVGWILVVVGLVGLIISIALWETALGWPRGPRPDPRRPRRPDEAPTRRFGP